MAPYRRFRLKWALGALSLVLFLAASAQAQQFKARMQTAVPTSSIYFELLKKFGERVDKMTGGRLKIEALPDGAVVPAFEILDAVDKGVVEAGYAWAHYWSVGSNANSPAFSQKRGGV